jgi:D-beta-D-heptose 7-phosphate kinase/D-beta-D-heptose 1-phosphate adenosyltransferase
MKASIVKNVIAGFKKTKILVVGDLILDLYIKGVVERISPEAPVPVVTERSRDYLLGGAGNVAANVAALGGGATLIGVVGNDREGKIMRRICSARGIASKFVSESGRPTALKTRATADRHQVLRIDREVAGPVKKSTEKKLVAILGRVKPHDVVVVSDYAKGCITKKVVETLKRRFGSRGIIVGAKPQHAALYKNVGLVVLNLHESQALIGIYGDTNVSAARAAKAVSKMFSSSAVLTRGECGITTYDKKSRKISHVETRAVQVYDVTGAGDTVLATVALMLASHASLQDAADVANHAAGIVVGIQGTATVNVKQLKTSLGQ